MLSQQKLDKLQRSLKGETYLELREFLTAHLDSLRDIDNVQEYSKAQDLAIELKAQIKAYKKLKLILSQIIGMEKEEARKTKNSNDFGL